MWGVRPAIRERSRQHGVVPRRPDEQLHVGGMSIGLLRGDKARADAYCGRTCREKLMHALGGADPTGGDDGHLNRRERLLESLVERLSAANVTSALHTLDRPEAAPGGPRPPAFGGRPSLPGPDRAAGPRETHERGIGVAVEELD